MYDNYETLNGVFEEWSDEELIKEYLMQTQLYFDAIKRPYEDIANDNHFLEINDNLQSLASYLAYRFCQEHNPGFKN